MPASTVEETDSYEWNTATWHGVEHHECAVCAYDCFGADTRPRMLAHCRRTGHGRVPLGALPRERWVEMELAQPNLVQGHRVTMAQLCWNTAEISAEAAMAMAKESALLERLGNVGQIATLDNGSFDDTFCRVVTTLREARHGGFSAAKQSVNRGISVARNLLIDMAREQGAEFVLLVDGDIEIVPVSVYTMMRYLDCHRNVGCIGAYSGAYTKDRLRMTGSLLNIEESRVKNDIEVAWTQYGLFRMSMFDQGIRFDEEGPFGEPGWGFEDDDLAFQMLERGWSLPYFGGMTYLHRNIRSSWVHIANQGYDVSRMYNKRKDYLIEKWSKRGYNRGKLSLIKAQQLPK